MLLPNIMLSRSCFQSDRHRWEI